MALSNLVLSFVNRAGTGSNFWASSGSGFLLLCPSLGRGVRKVSPTLSSS